MVVERQLGNMKSWEGKIIRLFPLRWLVGFWQKHLQNQVFEVLRMKQAFGLNSFYSLPVLDTLNFFLAADRWSCFYLCILVFSIIAALIQMVDSCLEVLLHWLVQHPFPLHLDTNGQLIDTEQSSWKMIFHLSPELNLGDIALGHMQLQLVYKPLLLIM